MTDRVTITVISGTTAGSFNIYAIHFDEFGDPDPSTRYVLELNVPLSQLLTGRTFLLDHPQEGTYGIILQNNADTNVGCVTGETQHFFSNVKIQNNFDSNIGNLQITAASFGSNIFLNLPSQNDGSSTYHHINTEVPIVDTVGVTIHSNELTNTLYYKLTVIDSNSVSFVTSGAITAGEDANINITGTTLSPDKQFFITLAVCTRPEGLDYQYSAYWGHNDIDFTDSLFDACVAMGEWGSGTFTGTAVGVVDLTNGQTVYQPHGTACTTLADLPAGDGYWLFANTGGVVGLRQIINGIIVAEPSCDEVTIGPLSIDDGACESYYNYTLSLTRNIPGYADYYVDWILRSGVTVLLNGYSYLTLYEGLNEFTPQNGACPQVAYGCFYQVNEYNDLTYSVHVRNMSANPTISNVFSSVGMTMGSINTIPTLTQGNSFGSDVSISITANAHCWAYLFWYVRNSSHGYVSSGYNYIELSAGTNDYFIDGIVPADPGINHDIQVRLDDSIPHIRTSNHFTIV